MVWLLFSTIVFIVIGLLPYDAKTLPKDCLFSWLKGCFVNEHHTADDSGFGVLLMAVLIPIWIFLSALLGWAASALLTFLKGLHADGSTAQPSDEPNGDTTPRRRS